LTRVVVDANVIVKCFLPEELSDAASRVLGSDLELWAPELAWAEVGNVLWKKWRKGELSEQEAQSLSTTIVQLPVRVGATRLLFEAAASLARRYDRSFYDSLYLAQAAHLGCPFVSADRRLFNALQGTELAASLLWVEDLPQ
jgi:predicted nucleic acid-binding protein